MHWTLAALTPGVNAVAVNIDGTNAGDGPYELQYSAQSPGNLLEPRHATVVVLDSTPPVTTILQPAATTYAHSATLTLNYSVSDGTGSGVASSVSTMDGATTLPGPINLQSGQPIKLLTELTLGPHTFNVNTTDNLGNSGSTSITFTIVVTPDSIKDDIQQFRRSGAINNHGIANSLLAKLDAAGFARSRGRCSIAANIYRAFINELQAQSGEHVDAAAAAIMIADARYLIAHCP